MLVELLAECYDAIGCTESNGLFLVTIIGKFHQLFTSENFIKIHRQKLITTIFHHKCYPFDLFFTKSITVFIALIITLMGSLSLDNSSFLVMPDGCKFCILTRLKVLRVSLGSSLLHKMQLYNSR